MTRFLVAVAALTLAAAVGRADTVDNPEYKDWAALKAGTTLTTKTVSEGKDVKSDVTVTVKLVQVAADKLVLETAVVATVNGKEMKEPAMKRDVPKTITVPAGAKPDPEKPEGTTAEGKETLKVGGTDVATRWYKFKAKTPDGDVEGQVWLSDAMPGKLVKSTTTAGGVKTTTEVTELKKP